MECQWRWSAVAPEGWERRRGRPKERGTGVGREVELGRESRGDAADDQEGGECEKEGLSYSRSSFPPRSAIVYVTGEVRRACSGRSRGALNGDGHIRGKEAEQDLRAHQWTS